MYQDVDRSNFRIEQFLEERMLSSNSLFFLRFYLYTRNRIEDRIRTIERLLIRFGFYPSTPFQTRREQLSSLLSQCHKRSKWISLSLFLSRFPVFLYILFHFIIAVCSRFTNLDIKKSREKKLSAIKLLLNDKNKFFDSMILYEFS